jgi:predicted GNAT family acetyltransferase
MNAPLHITHRPEAHCFDADVQGQRAVCDYRQVGQVLDLHHTGVPPASQGQGHAAALVQAALAYARDQGLKVRPSCSYVAAYMRRHPETLDLLAP